MPNFLHRTLIFFVTLLATHCAVIEKEPLAVTQKIIPTSSGGSQSNPQPGVYLASTVVSAPGNTGAGYYNQQNIINGVRGAGLTSGSFDVFSLDNIGASSSVTVSWSGKTVQNVTGIDFVVYENAFQVGGNILNSFMDLAFVEVSSDDINYCGFATAYTNIPATTYSSDPLKWQNFAGKSAVLYNQDTNNLTATDLFVDNNNDRIPDLGGGDGFDLSLLSSSNYYNTGCSVAVRDNLILNGFRYLRLTPAARRIDPNTGVNFVTDPIANGPDFDGVVARSIF